MDVLTLGETMISMVSITLGSLEHVNTYEQKIAGAESNVAIGLARIGPIGWGMTVSVTSFIKCCVVKELMYLKSFSTMHV